ncbi:MAG: hypothetical protein E6R14_12100 [Thermomicrobiales bacterium]|nr:MAG: hypothetical protein E6R14_12100 [Thermomicrobiales bacterium]
MDASDNQIRRIVVERMDRCTVCHRRFVEDDVEVVSRKSDVWLMIVQCKDCHSRSFAAVVGETSGPIDTESLFGFPSSGSIEITFETDGEYFDIEPYNEEPEPPVTVDDLLEIHEFLDSFDGDFKTLFADQPKG